MPQLYRIPTEMTPFKQMRSARDLALEVEEVIEINQLGLHRCYPYRSDAGCFAAPDRI